MTSYDSTRCYHCQERYTRQVSGADLGGHRDDRFCSTCYKVVKDGLSGIARKYEPRWISVTQVPRFKDVTLDMVLAWKREADAERVEGKIYVTRIWPGLFNVETGEMFSFIGILGRDKFKGILFQVGTWRLSPEGSEINVEMEFDIQKEELTGNLWSE